jgi:predicted DsbA family dithiol-disulfide isomerase
MRVDIWSDIVCPWCYVGKRRFEKALATFDGRDTVAIVHRSFQLDPRSPRGQTFDRKQMLQQKYGWSTIQVQQADAQMTQLAAAEGLDYKLAGGVTGNTMDAHQVVHLARERGIADAVVERLYRAHFTEQRSIFDRESLVAIATEAGLDAADVRDTLERDVYVGAVTADNAEAHSLGANGVPFFVLNNRFAVSGAQPVATFVEALAQAGSQTPGA